MKVTINTDGASHGNPGSAAIGAVIKDGRGWVIATISQAIGRTTNNQAEYRAVIAALERALEIGATQVELCSDSELLIRQLEGQYRVRKAALLPLHQRLKQLREQFERFDIVHVPGEQNGEAHNLASQALK